DRAARDLGESFDLAIAPADDAELSLRRPAATLRPLRRREPLVLRHRASRGDRHRIRRGAVRTRLRAPRWLGGRVRARGAEGARLRSAPGLCRLARAHRALAGSGVRRSRNVRAARPTAPEILV